MFTIAAATFGEGIAETGAGGSAALAGSVNNSQTTAGTNIV